MMRTATLADLGPQDPLTMYGPYLLAMLVVMVAVSFTAPDFDPRVFFWFCLFVGMQLETLYLRQSSWVTTGLWFDWVKRVYAIHEYLEILNIFPVMLALTGVCAAFTLLKPYFTKWTCPVPLDLSASEKYKYAGYILVAFVSPVILASYPLLSSFSFLLFVAWYLFGAGMLIHWCIENEKKRKAAAPAAATSTKGGISMSPTTHSRVKEFWRTQMFPRVDLTNNMDFETFTKDVKGSPALVRNNKILTLFKQTLEEAKLVVDDNRTDIQKAY